MDEDEENTPNSLVSYRLVQAPPGLESNFTVNAATGEVSLTRPLDYEQLDPALAGRVTLVVEAFDAGTPQKSSQVMVNITVEVRPICSHHCLRCLCSSEVVIFVYITITNIAFIVFVIIIIEVLPI